jgi:hypothetical protein
MIRLHWSYADLLACPTEHLVAIMQILGETDADSR